MIPRIYRVRLADIQGRKHIWKKNFFRETGNGYTTK